MRQLPELWVDADEVGDDDDTDDVDEDDELVLPPTY